MQYKFDFSPQPIDLGKMVPQSFSCPELLQKWITEFAKATNQNLSPMILRWVISGFTSEFGEQFLVQPLLREKLISLSSKKF